MKRIVVICFLLAMYLTLSVSAYAIDQELEHIELSDYKSDFEMLGEYEDVAEALLCAACISYGETPEDCVTDLKSRGFNFEYDIQLVLPDDFLDYYDATYDNAGGPEIPMMRQASLVFSPTVTLYMRTEPVMVPLKPADVDTGLEVEDMWMPDGEIPEEGGEIVYAHLKFFDEEKQQWITWTFTSKEDYISAQLK